MFTDRVPLDLFAGKGGDGTVAFRREKFLPKGGPYGGDGGRGGSIIFRSSPHPFCLESFRNLRKISAKNGENGGAAFCTGKSGKNIVLDVPLGTLIKDAATDEVLFDFTKINEEFIVCQGGVGGKGNTHFKSSTNRTPRQYTPGTKGEQKQVILELKLLADIGLVGLPNAGKSTLISSLTPINAKIGAYPFTTLKPNLGLITFTDNRKQCIADIPGIIKGAHQNKGLGHAFLRHIERTNILLFVLDVFSPTFLQDLSTLQNELLCYKKTLLEKPCLVLLNKTDIPGAQQLTKEFHKKYPNTKTLSISAQKKTGLQDVLHFLESFLPKREAFSQDEVVDADQTLQVSHQE